MELAANIDLVKRTLNVEYAHHTRGADVLRVCEGRSPTWPL